MGLAWGFDANWTPQRDGSYSWEQLYRFIYDLQDEPQWRRDAAREAAYYDGRQLDSETLQLQKELGIPPYIINMIQPAVNAVLGYEALMRSDPMVLAENEMSIQGAEALNEKLKEAVRRTHFNREVARAFADMVKVGIGWVEVSRNPNPKMYRYQVRRIPWREMWFDWRSREDNYGDWRYIIRSKWYDGDYAGNLFPRHRKLIKYASRGWPNQWWNVLEQVSDDESENLARAYQREITVSLEDDEWRNVERGRVRVYEMLYRVPRRLKMLVLPDDRRVEFDPKDPLHQAVYRGGFAEIMDGMHPDVRQAFYVGPHRLYDAPLPYDDSHYIPMVAYRQDSDGIPFGLIRQMISPQDAVNAHRSRLTYDTLSNKAVVDEDAVDDHEETAHELGRRDAYITLKSDRRRDKALEIVGPPQTSPITMELLGESKRNIFDSSGITPESLGQIQSAGQSGVAIENLIGQGNLTLGPIVSNYRDARRTAARRLLEMITMDLSDRPDVAVNVMREGMMGEHTSKMIMLNARSGEGQIITNQVAKLRTRVALSEAPSSPTYLAQKFRSLTEMVKSMPPELQGAMLPLLIRASGAPYIKELLDVIREATGMGPPPEDPEERAAYFEKKQREAAMAQRMQEVDLLEREAEARKIMADAELIIAKARKTAGVDTEHTAARTSTELAKIGMQRRDQDRKDVDQNAELIKAGAEIAALSRQPEAQSTAKPRKSS